MVDVEIRSNIEEVFERIEGEMNSDIAKLLLKAATFAGGAIQESVWGTFKDQSGALARSFLPARMVQVEGKGVAAAAVSDLPYAAIQDEGGTIRSKRAGGRLAVPVSPEAKKRWPRDWPRKQLFLLAMKDRNQAVLAERVGKREKLKIHYVLRHTVKIDATDYIGRARQAAEPEILEILEHGTQELLDKADK